MRDEDDHYLKKELYALIKRDPSIFEFLEQYSLDGLWYWDLETPENEWLSPRFWELLGYDPAEKRHLASEWQHLIYPEDLQTALRNLEAHCKDPQHPYDQLVRYRHKDGSTVWVRCRGVAIRDRSGSPVRLLGAHNDVTQVKAAEDALRRSQAQLEQRVKERTVELAETNEQLRTEIAERARIEKALQKAKQEAERANAAKSRFLAAASHDLRQPLQTLSLLIGVLKETVEVQEPVKEVINNLGGTLTFMGDLLDTLLDINRLESGVITPHTTDFSVIRLFNRLKTRFETQAKKKGLELHVVPCRAMLRSDEVLLERIVQNILANAIRYTSMGKVLLGCRRRGSNLRIEVWDTGPGIPEEQRAMIFEDYYQLNNPARDRQKGLGLGLAIVDRAARLLGHRVDVRSTVGKGSMFYLEVPLGTAQPDTQVRPKVEQTGYLEPTEITIVLIEDDQAVLEGMRLFLEVAGFQVITAKTGRDAIAQFEGQPLGVTLIITDYRLPEGETGTQAIQQFRETFGQPLPAILLTGDTTPELLREAENCGCQLLRKPVDGDKLIALIHQLLQMTQLGGMVANGVGI